MHDGNINVVVQSQLNPACSVTLQKTQAHPGQGLAPARDLAWPEACFALAGSLVARVALARSWRLRA